MAPCCQLGGILSSPLLSPFLHICLVQHVLPVVCYMWLIDGLLFFRDYYLNMLSAHGHLTLTSSSFLVPLSLDINPTTVSYLFHSLWFHPLASTSPHPPAKPPPPHSSRWWHPSHVTAGRLLCVMSRYLILDLYPVSPLTHQAGDMEPGSEAIRQTAAAHTITYTLTFKQISSPLMLPLTLSIECLILFSHPYT